MNFLKRRLMQVQLAEAEFAVPAAIDALFPRTRFERLGFAIRTWSFRVRTFVRGTRRGEHERPQIYLPPHPEYTCRTCNGRGTGCEACEGLGARVHGEDE